MKDIQNLIEKYKDGDPRSFNQIVHQLEPWLRMQISKRIFDREAVYDICQITFMEALKNIHKYDSNLNFKNWIAGIARLQSLKYLEKWSTRKKHEDQWSLLKISEIEEKDILASSEDPLDDRLSECMDQLKEKNEKHYELFKAKYESKKSLKDLAEEQSSTVAAIGMMLKRIRETLKQCLEGKKHD